MKSRPSIPLSVFRRLVGAIRALLALAVVHAHCAEPDAEARKRAALLAGKRLGSAMSTYARAHDGHLPDLGKDETDRWEKIALPALDTVWYNALPRLLKLKSAGDFLPEKRLAAFYSAENPLYVPGLTYPEAGRLDRPYFAIAANELLYKRQDGKSWLPKISNIQNTSRTVAFLERGLPGEPRAHAIQKEADYTGSPRGGPGAFVARHQQRGILWFFDGHAELVTASQIFTADGKIKWSSATENDPSAILWTADPKVDPNTLLAPPPK
jgi:prepilin-type processing-associated H-X9-DG protein